MWGSFGSFGERCVRPFAGAHADPAKYSSSLDTCPDRENVPFARYYDNLVTSTAAANALSAAQDVPEGALSLQVSKCGCTQGGVRGLGFRNRKGCAHRILDMSYPGAQVCLGGYVRGRI